MIAILLYDLRWRLLGLLGVAVAFYAAEPGFHQHEDLDFAAVALGPMGISATLANFAAISMIVLLAGFISRDRQEGYTRLIFSSPTSPLAYYGLRLAIAYLIAITGAALFLGLGQIIAWRSIPTGWSGMILPVLSALIYGGLVSLLSVLLPRGDSWVALLLLILPIGFPQLFTMGLSGAPPVVRRAILLLLPPQGALAQVWEGLVLGSYPWDATLYAAAYGILLLLAAGLLLRAREFP